MLISVKVFGAIASDFGVKDISLATIEENITLQALLVILKGKYPSHFPQYFDEDFTPKRGTLILINGVDFNTIDGMETVLSAADQISLIPTISGG